MIYFRKLGYPSLIKEKQIITEREKNYEYNQKNKTNTVWSLWRCCTLKACLSISDLGEERDVGYSAVRDSDAFTIHTFFFGQM